VDLRYEDLLAETGIPLSCDRVDIELQRVEHPLVVNQFKMSVEDMSSLPSDGYHVVIGNWVLEHVRDIPAAVREISRVMRPGARFFTTLPNPRTIEFTIAKLTPTSVHRLIRKHESWPTLYAYKSIDNLIRMFQSAGCRLAESRFQPAFEIYLYRYPIINYLARTIDYLIIHIGKRALRGMVYLGIEKESPA